MKYRFRLYILLIFIAAGHLAACTARPGSFAPQPGRDTIVAGFPYVYDGDSLFFGATEVRLTGIDAPELRQTCRDAQGRRWPCGITSRRALRALVDRREVRCVLAGRDKYRRFLGTCYVGSQDINAAMAQSGNAIAYLYFTDEYAAQQAQAKRAGSGIWQDGDFTDPYYCRHKVSGHVCHSAPKQD